MHRNSSRIGHFQSTTTLFRTQKIDFQYSAAEEQRKIVICHHYFEGMRAPPIQLFRSNWSIMMMVNASECMQNYCCQFYSKHGWKFVRPICVTKTLRSTTMMQTFVWETKRPTHWRPLSMLFANCSSWWNFGTKKWIMPIWPNGSGKTMANSSVHCLWLDFRTRKAMVSKVCHNFPLDLTVH